MRTTIILAVVTLALPLALGASACDTVYEFDEVAVGGDDSARVPRDKTNSQFLRSVYADLLGRTPEVYDFVVSFGGMEAFRFALDEQALLLGSLESVGDPTPMRGLIAAGLAQSLYASIPDKADVADPETFIRDQFRRLLGRDPGPYELRAFLDEWQHDAKVTPQVVVRALIASREYQSL
jgi:hypothetical protein